MVGEAAAPSFDLAGFLRGERVAFVPSGVSADVDPARALLITDLRVVEDPTRTFNPCTGEGTPMGVWTFGHLLKEMANEPVTGINPSAFARDWLAQWETRQIANGDPVDARPGVQQVILDQWQAASGGPEQPLDLARAPFRLLAIVNRVDLRDNAGEGRFVFCAVNTQTGKALQFTVIFEYGVPRRGTRAVRAWGKRWLNLQKHPPGSPPTTPHWGGSPSSSPRRARTHTSFLTAAP